MKNSGLRRCGLGREDLSHQSCHRNKASARRLRNIVSISIRHARDKHGFCPIYRCLETNG